MYIYILKNPPKYPRFNISMFFHDLQSVDGVLRLEKGLFFVTIRFFYPCNTVDRFYL